MQSAGHRNPSSDESWSRSHRASDRVLDLAAPFCPGRGDMGSDNGGVEHLDEMSGLAHGGKRLEECLEHARLAQPPEPFPHAVPVAKFGGQRPPGDVVDRKIVQSCPELLV